MTQEEIELLIQVSDADGVYTMLLDYGYDEEAQWVEDNYFK